MPVPVYLPEDVHKALRIAAIEEGRSAADIIRALVKEYLVKREKRRGVIGEVGVSIQVFPLLDDLFENLPLP